MKIPVESPESILTAYVADFRKDPAAATARTFGVRVVGDAASDWSIVVGGAKDESGSWQVELRKGLPTEPTFVYTVQTDTLRAVHDGDLNALTAQGKAYPSDPAPMDADFMPGADEFDVNPFSFHFWTRGWPEKVPFGADLTREVHGADNVAVYYQKGLRTVWTKLDKGDRVNNGPGQPMLIPFPILVFATKGRSVGTVGGVRTKVEAGEVLFIPAMTPYEFWNEDEEPSEAILVMFGKGA